MLLLVQTNFGQDAMLPTEIILEVTNHCNLKCKFCHIHGNGSVFSRKKGMMPRKIWEKILEEIAGWSVNVSLITHGAGEPLLYPNLKELLIEAKKLSNATVGFMTNAMLLDEQMSKFLVENRIDWIALSIDGTEPETHDAVRRGARLERIERNLNKLIRLKKDQGSERPLLKFNMVMYPGFEDQKMKYLERWLPHAESIMFSKFRPVGEKTLWTEAKDEPEFEPCQLLFRQAVIAWDGRMALCCEDIHIEASPGDVSKNSLEDIFNHSQVYKRYRQDHQRGEISDLPLCKDCHIWASGKVLEEKEIDVAGIAVRWTKTLACEKFTVN